MAQNRDIVVRLDADTAKLERGFKSAEASAKIFERELKKVEQAAQRSAADVAHVGRLRERHEKQTAVAVEQAAARQAEAHRSIGLAASIAGAAIAVGLGKAVSASMDFEKGLSALRAATGASASSMDALRASALKVGEDTSFSATEAVDAQVALAKAGISTADILGGALAGAASLAAAGQLDMGAAAEVAATAMTQFKLAGQDVPHIADLLAAGAGKAQGDVSDLAQALNQAGLVASQTGLTIEETTGGLSAFASAGLLGSDAGTSFKTMLQRLNPQSDEAAELMDELGLRAYDSQGAFVGLSEYAGQLQSALGGMSAEQRNAAMSTLFGSDAVRAAAVLYEQGSAGVEGWEAAVADAGFASRTAATMTDNLAGDLERLGGSIETALIKNGSAGNAVLRTLVQTADGAVGAFSDLPGPVQGVATGVAALTGAVSLAAGAFLLGAPKVTAFKESLGDLGPRSQRFGKGILGVGAALGGPWGLALAGGVTALGFFAQAKADARAEVDAFTDAITADSGAIGENARQTAVAALEKRGMLEAADELGLSLQTVTDAALGDKAALAELRAAAADYNDTALDMANATSASNGMLDENAVAAGVVAGEARSLVGDVEDLAGATQEGMDAARRNAEALGEQGDAQGELGGAVQSTTGAVQEQTESLADLMEQVRGLSDQVLGLRGSERDFEAALDAVTEAAQKNGQTLDINTEKGRDNEAALDGIARSANDVLTAMVESGAPIDAVSAKMATQREALVRAAIGFGMSEAAASEYADSVLRIPSKADTAISVNTQQAAAQLEAHLRQLGRIPESITTRVFISEIRRDEAAANRGPVQPRARGGLIARAAGGFVSGPGGPTDDLIPALLSNGEYVLQASAVRTLGIPALNKLNQAAQRSSLAALSRLPVGLAGGGTVGSATGSPGALHVPTTTVGSLVATAVSYSPAAEVRALQGAWA